MSKKSPLKAAGRRSLKPFRFRKGTVAHWFSGKRPVLLGGPSQSASVKVMPPEVESIDTARVIAASKAEKGFSRPARYDEQGYILPFTEAEREGVRRMIEELKSIHNGPEEDDREFMRAMDANRPDFPLFEGMY